MRGVPARKLKLFIMTFGNEYSKENWCQIPFCLVALLRTEFLKELLLVHKSIAQLRTIVICLADHEVLNAIKICPSIFQIRAKKICKNDLYFYFSQNVESSKGTFRCGARNNMSKNLFEN